MADRQAVRVTTSATEERGGPDPSVVGSVGIMLTSAMSAQTGAAIGAHAFPLIGPAGVVAIRQLVAVCVLLPTARPPVRSFTREKWTPVVALAVVLATMNLSLYSAIERIGLALAITLEFLGPLAVALIASRSRRDLGRAIVAGVGVYVLVLPQPSSNWLGIGLALYAACCWAAYIVLNRIVGARVPGVQGPAVATTITAAAYLPVVVSLVVTGRLTPAALAFSVAAGLLSSVIPFTFDLVSLRRVSPRFFSIVQSFHPVFAALAGLVLLGQVLALHEWIGILIVVAVNVAAVAWARGAQGRGVVTTEPGLEAASQI
jgi:inner membrane transporter RhtA